MDRRQVTPSRLDTEGRIHQGLDASLIRFFHFFDRKFPRQSRCEEATLFPLLHQRPIETLPLNASKCRPSPRKIWTRSKLSTGFAPRTTRKEAQSHGGDVNGPHCAYGLWLSPHRLRPKTRSLPLRARSSTTAVTPLLGWPPAAAATAPEAPVQHRNRDSLVSVPNTPLIDGPPCTTQRTS